MGAAVAYVFFIVCLRFMSYFPATIIAWGGSIGFGFLVNRRFTFSIRGVEGRARQAALYTVGALLQLGIALAGYAWLLGRLHWSPTPAFLANTAVTAAFGFAFQSVATFRRRATRPR